MKISIPPELLNRITHNQNVLNLKIITIKQNSSVVLILNKQFEIPFKLDENKQYQAVLKNNELFIRENSKKSLLSGLQEKFIDQDSHGKREVDVLKDVNLASAEVLKMIAERIDDKNKKNVYFSSKRDNDQYFVFNIPLYDRESKVFIKIDKDKNVFLNILSENRVKPDESENLSNNLKKRLKNKSGMVNLVFSDKKENFYNKIFSLINLKNVDINI